MSLSPVRFETQLLSTGPNTTGVVVPPEIIAALGAGARPAVVALLNGYSYRTTVGVMRGQAMLPFSAAHREASGLKGGDALTVELTLDDKPRTAEVPGDLAEALAVHPDLRARFDGQAPSRQRADVEAVNSAKTAETRARRIQAIIVRLRG